MRMLTLASLKLLTDLMTELEALKMTNLTDYYLNLYEPSHYVLTLQWDESYFPPVTDELEFTIEPNNTITTIEVLPEHFDTVAEFMQYILS